MSVWLASRRSSPSPAAAMPSISRGVAQQKPVWPLACSRRANAVDFHALTWGRSFVPGHASPIVRMLWSNAARSTSSAGVVRSWMLTVGQVGTSGRSRSCGRRLRSRRSGAPHTPQTSWWYDVQWLGRCVGDDPVAPDAVAQPPGERVPHRFDAWRGRVRCPASTDGSRARTAPRPGTRCRRRR